MGYLIFKIMTTYVKAIFSGSNIGKLFLKEMQEDIQDSFS